MSVRRGLLLLVAAAAAVSVFAGLARVGLAVPGASYAGDHGPLFVLGVFGAVIALERAVALQTRWALVVPALGAAGAALLVAGLRTPAQLALTAGAAGQVVINAVIVRRQPHLFTVLMLLASLALTASAALWMRDAAVFEVAPAWLAFFVLTIVAERLELSRLVPTPALAVGALVVCAVTLLGLALAAPWWPRAGVLLGIPMALLGLWELRFDIARRTVRQPGLPRFAAVSVFLGAAWLVAGGALRVALGVPPAGPAADAVVHAVMIGFVLGMVFAHAPIILPSVAKLAVPFHPLLYVPVAALHLTLVARIAGDLLESHPLRSAGAIGNAISLVLFAVAVAVSRSLARSR